MSDAKKTVVLAYSGGLDTSCILVWLREQGYTVVAFLSNLGQEEDFDAARKKALSLGAIDVVISDQRQELVEDFVWPSVQADLIYEDRYLLGTALARPCIVKGIIRVVNQFNAGFISHGATGKGNDQIRFELGCYALCPSIQIIAPWKDPEFYQRFKGRADLFKYAQDNGIPLPVTPKAPWSMDANMIHISFESGVLEDPAAHAPKDIFQLTVDPEDAPDQGEIVTISFVKGLPTKFESKDKKVVETKPLQIFTAVNQLGARHGVGRIDIVENRYIGLKSRGLYETPGLTVLRTAHQDLEAMCIDKEVRSIKQRLSITMSNQVYCGYWFSPEFEYTHKCVAESQHRVNGTVTLKIYKGNVYVLGRWSPVSLYNQELVSMDVQGDYEPSDAKGFIRVNAVRLREHQRIKQEDPGQ